MASAYTAYDADGGVLHVVFTSRRSTAADPALEVTTGGH